MHGESERAGAGARTSKECAGAPDRRADCVEGEVEREAEGERCGGPGGGRGAWAAGALCGCMEGRGGGEVYGRIFVVVRIGRNRRGACV